jgi:cytoskeletal protein CcmA (bactofilin family)
VSRLPETDQGLIRKLRAEQRRRISDENASPYARSGMSVTAPRQVTVDGELVVNGPLDVTETAEITGTTHIGGDTTIDGTTTIAGSTTIDDALHITGSTDIDGTLNVDAATTIGGTLGVTGNATFSGAMAIAGTLSLPAGIIDNEALAAPVAVGRVSQSQTGFATTTTDQDFANGYITVPAGFTQALVYLTVSAGHSNTSGSIDYLYLSAGINGTTSREVFGLAQPGLPTMLATARSSLLTGLTAGAQIHVRCRIHTQGNAWASGAASRAYTEAQAIFLR